MTKEMPETYQPSVLRTGQLRPKMPIRYGIGIQDTQDRYGLTQGPFETLVEALECPALNGEMIILLDPYVCNKPIYYWEDDKWIKVK